MLQQAPAVSTSEPSPGQTEKQFKCDQCEFSSESQRGFKVHMGRSHKDLQLPENLRDDECEEFLAVSPLKEVREELPEVSSPTSVSDSVAECGFECACCGQRCQSEEALRIHLRDKHGLPRSALIVKRCTSTLSHWRPATKHTRALKQSNSQNL